MQVNQRDWVASHDRIHEPLFLRCGPIGTTAVCCRVFESPQLGLDPWRMRRDRIRLCGVRQRCYSTANLPEGAGHEIDVESTISGDRSGNCHCGRATRSSCRTAACDCHDARRVSGELVARREIDDDPEIPDDRHLAIVVRTSFRSVDELVACQWKWHERLFACCPAPLAPAFRLSTESWP